MTQISLLVLFLFPAFTISGQIARSIAIAMCLLCCHPKTVKKLAEPGILLLTWFAWAVFCSYQSDNFQLSLFGYHKRFEGIITWILAISFGWLFWRTSKLNSLFITCGLILAICLGAMIFRPDIYKNVIFGHIAIGAFAAIVACMFMVKHPLYIGIALPFIAITLNRSMLLALLFGAMAYGLVHRKKLLESFKTWKPWAVCGVIFTLCVIAAYPKLKNIDPRSFGSGARTDFARQTIQASIIRPILGYGIDSQSKILIPPINDKSEYRWDSRPDGTQYKVYFNVDRCHNFLLDILLQTGLVGVAIWVLILTRMTYRTLLMPNEINQACLYGTAAVMGFGMMNPFGIPAMFLLCLCVLGIERKDE